MNIIISGATKGIGKAICELFASQSWNVAICSRTASELNAFHKELEEKYPEIQVISKQTDVGNKQEVEAFVDYVAKSWDQVDVLVNNAGIFLPGKCLEEEDGHLEKQLSVNLNSAYHLTRKAIGLIRKSERGHIFNMCSVASLFAYPNGGSYSISKFALYGFTKVLREELKTENIRVTAIIPGATWSDSWAGANFPKERLMRAEDIANSVFHAVQMHPTAVVEEILIRPQLGDL